MSEAVAVAAEPMVEPVSTEAVDDSLAAHEAQFGKGQPAPAVVDDDAAETAPAASVPTRRHRTKDIATPADVPRIRELSAKVKAKDAEIAEWRAKYEAASKPSPAPAVALTPAPVMPAAASSFTEVEPKLEQFQDKDDPYFAWQRATAAYDRRKETFEAQQTQATKDAETERTAGQQRAKEAWAAIDRTYDDRLKLFTQRAPDFHEKLKAAGDVDISALMGVAIKTLENGPEVAYHLFSRPDLMAEAHLMGDGKAITDTAVAAAQRWLLSRVLTGTTGAVAATSTVKPPPRPPTPVQTGPIASGDDPPGDASTLAEHEKAFGRRRHRR